MPKISVLLLSLTLFGVLVSAVAAQPAQSITPVCPQNAIVTPPSDFQSGSIILTMFDREALWVFNTSGGNRYPLPMTVPCTRNCSVSPDGFWLARLAPENNYSFYKMRMDGTQRTFLANNAADVEWWNAETLLVWTPDHRAYLLPESAATDPAAPREYLDVRNVIAVQPNGRHALAIAQDETLGFVRVLENLETRNLVGVAVPPPVVLGQDVTYYNDAAWSPNGEWLTFVQQTALDPNTGSHGSELFAIRPQDEAPTQLTQLFAAYGAARINGHSVGDLSWSPDGTHIAFWVIELIGADPLANTGNATIHIYDITTHTLRAYCGFTTVEHTPTPPRLIWSPDGTHIAFGGNIPNDEEGYLLLALNIVTGEFVKLSSGIYPALGAADVVAWGRMR